MTKKPVVGAAMPHFQLLASDGLRLDSQALLGKGPFVLFFYPKDFTAGCTAEVCHFRDSHSDFQAAGARVIGISPDPIAIHRTFASKHALPFTLLSDPDGQVGALFGLQVRLGIIFPRQTFVMDAEGIIRHHTSDVLRMKRHTDEALEVVRRLAGPSAEDSMGLSAPGSAR